MALIQNDMGEFVDGSPDPEEARKLKYAEMRRKRERKSGAGRRERKERR